MNWDTMKGDWKQFKGKIREKWGELTDDEIEQVKGHREQFEGLLQKKFRHGQGRSEAAGGCVREELLLLSLLSKANAV
jgi:uncharacterized protein YjbJ (UPF0337 family)